MRWPEKGVCKTRNLPGTYRNLPEPTETCRNQPEPTGTPRNLPGTLKKAQMIKLKKKQITKNNTNQIKIMKMK